MIMSRFSGITLVLMFLSLASRGEALFRRSGGGGAKGGQAPARPPPAGIPAAPPSGGTGVPPQLTPAMIEQVARRAADAIVMWGTSTVFQLKQAAQLKGQVDRLRASPEGLNMDGKAVRMDDDMYKQVVQGAIGGVFLTLNSPAMGKVSKSDKSILLLKDPKRQTRVIDLDKRVKEAFGKGDGKGKKGPTDPDGFLEGALLNRDVAAAHDKYMSDVEALASSSAAKKVSSSAEAYHQAMMEYATSEKAAPRKRR